MTTPTTYRKIAEFKNVSEFREYLQAEHFDIPVSDVAGGPASAANRPLGVCGKTAGNRWCILPMEGWDCDADGVPTERTRRRWMHFATSGAKLLFGTEACAVMESARSNPRQLMISEKSFPALKTLVADMRNAHKERFGRNDDLLIGLQLTHSGRFAHPHDDFKLEPRTAYAHPLLDVKFKCGPETVVSDEETRDIIQHFITAAKLAQEAGFDFVDIKHAHGYLGHEFLSAVDRPAPYGGSFENRTRFFREIAEGIHDACPGLSLACRLSIFDIFPFVKGADGYGEAMPWSGNYPYAFGGDGTGMGMDPDLHETVQFVKLLQSYGVDLICATIGSPYYNVHMQRPAYFPVCDGYLPPENPLKNVARHLLAVKRLRELCPGVKVVGSGYTCLQEFLPNVAEAVLQNNDADFIGIGRMVLSYPDFCADVLEGKPLDRRHICRTFGDCTNGPRHGMVSGCYPLDEYYRNTPEFLKLKNSLK